MKPGIDIMVSEENKPKKLYPWYVLVIADVLLTAVILCTFSYFHHVRMLWCLGPYKNNDDAAVYKITKPVAQTTEAVPATEPVTTAEEITAPPIADSEQPSSEEPADGGEELDVSGDFGALFPAIFIQDGERVTLNSDEEIKAYAAKN